MVVVVAVVLGACVSRAHAQAFALDGLELFVGSASVALTPAFDSAVKNYAATVPYGTRTIKVKARWTEPTAPPIARSALPAAASHGACPKDFSCTWEGGIKQREAIAWWYLPNPPRDASGFFTPLVSGTASSVESGWPCSELTEQNYVVGISIFYFWEFYLVSTGHFGYHHIHRTKKHATRYTVRNLLSGAPGSSNKLYREAGR